MQEDIVIEDGIISGTLKYVTGYTGFSGDVSEQSGNYIALYVDTDADVDSITCELIGGTVGHPVTLDSDRNIVIRITNIETQRIRFVVSRDGQSQTVNLALTGLTLNNS